MDFVRRHAALLIICAFVLGTVNGLGIMGLSVYANNISNTAQAEIIAPAATLTPRQEPRTAYYIGVYDACKLFAVQAAGMSDEESSLECLGFVSRVKDANWYETSGK